ncbi:hypothetical protein AB0M11_27660 [Streptomyces sp. NPDC051987]|uniref:hypothetical protein n=1 Tax=Streptomyces sp. NPDC051987 TaxID=3155808 RepID=UPI00342AD557
MGRRENPVDRTVPEKAKLADFLRARRDNARITSKQMAARSTVVSAATFERAASGTHIPSWETVAEFILATAGEGDIHAVLLIEDRARQLWIKARRATRAPFHVATAPDPTLLSSPADLARALRHQHVWAGYPTPGEMERMSGPGILPRTTARRIIEGDVLPVDPQQAIAFLKACYVVKAADLQPWLAAAVRVLPDVPSRSRDLDSWVRAHRQMVRQAQTEAAAQAPPMSSQNKQAA